MMEVHQFNVKSLEQTCFEFLRDHLCPDNCIGLWQFTKFWYIPIIIQLKYEAFHFICENFEDVSLCEEFLKLTKEELADILGQDDLTVTQESKVYESVLRWINHMPEERQGDISTLLPKVRLGLMDKRYVRRNVLKKVKTNPESHLLVSETLKVMSKPWLLSSKSEIINTLFCRRLPNAVLLMFRSLFNNIEAFDYITNSWITVHNHPSQEDIMTHLSSTVFLDRCLYRTVFHRGYLYIVVRVIRTSPFNRVWRFNLVKHTWHEMSPMQELRYAMSVTVLKGCIYVMGGYSFDFTSLRTAERYQPNINQWTFIASMNEERMDASCTTLNNKIYICGGRKNHRSLNTAEYYNPYTNQWTLITPMRRPRCGHGVVAYMGHIFAVGGKDEFVDLRSAEAYDPVTNTWYDVPAMRHTQSYFGIAVMNKQIFVCGDSGNIVECYDKTTNTWSVVFSGTNHTTHYRVSCCVISRLPNMADYYSPREPIIP